MRFLKSPAQLWSVLLDVFLRIVVFCTHGVSQKKVTWVKKKSWVCQFKRNFYHIVSNLQFDF